MISLSVVFFLNDTMFYRESFEGMRNLINHQVTWAFLFLTIGLIRLIILLINGAYWRTPHFRAVTAFLSAGVWFLLTIGFIRNGSVLAAILPWVFLLDAYNIKRASREAGKSEYVQRYMKTKQEKFDAGKTFAGTHA